VGSQQKDLGAHLPCMSASKSQMEQPTPQIRKVQENIGTDTVETIQQREAARIETNQRGPARQQKKTSGDKLR